MSADKDTSYILKLTDGLWFTAGPDRWFVPSLKVALGSWVALVPEDPEPAVDPSGSLAWTLATMQEPVRGSMELFGNNIYQMDHGARQRIRANIGFVHGYGGLLSGSTVRENIALPVSVHRRLNTSDEAEVVAHIIRRLALEKVADLRPHEMDGSTRWRACLARALVLEPQWVILEGIGNWEMDRGRGTDWQCIVETQKEGASAIAICLARQNPEFEAWFEEHDGTIVRFKKSMDREQETEKL
jgi:predicted ABC-type transport system involved in lysophospholipase L1 biosynthesis ATPase subunit